MNLYNFKVGDRIIFKTDWDPGFAPDEVFFIEPVPAGTLGTIIDIREKCIRVRLDDKEKWPKPVSLFRDDDYNDEVQGGYDCIGKLVVN